MRELRFGVDDEGFGTTRVRLLIDQHAIVQAAVDKAVDGAPAREWERATHLSRFGPATRIVECGPG